MQTEPLSSSTAFFSDYGTSRTSNYNKHMSCNRVIQDMCHALFCVVKLWHAMILSNAMAKDITDIYLGSFYAEFDANKIT